MPEAHQSYSILIH